MTLYIHVIFSYYVFKVYINLIYVCKIKLIINYIGIVFAFSANREVFFPFGDKFVNNSIITKHILLIYIQFIFKNYQIATSLGYTYRRHKNVNNFNKLPTHHNFNEVFPFNVF